MIRFQRNSLSGLNRLDKLCALLFFADTLGYPEALSNLNADKLHLDFFPSEKEARAFCELANEFFDIKTSWFIERDFPNTFNFRVFLSEAQ